MISYDSSFVQVLNKAYYLGDIGIANETRTAFQQLGTALDEFVRKTFNEWTMTVDENSLKRLEISLMQKNAVTKDMLSMNFDRLVKNYRLDLITLV